MANNTEDIKWLYGKLKAKGYDIGSEQEFTSSLANEADRNWYYGKAVGMGLDVGSKEDFNSLFTPGSADAQQGEPETLALKQTADATGKETGRAEAETASRGSGAEGQGGKPKWLIDAMARRAVAGAEAFVSNLETQKEKNRRVAESGTQKGRDRVKAGERLARMAGKPARVLGISSPLPPEETGGAKASMSGAGPTVAASPHPYGVKMVDGKVKTEWLLPDGTLTTDLAEADMAENVARKTRMAHEHEKNVQAAVKDAVERAVAADDERSREESEAYMRNPSNMVGGVNAELGHAARRARAGIGDLEKIAESAYESIPEEYRKELESSYRQYFREHPDALNGKRIEDAARDAVRSDCYREVHEVYVGRNMPSNNSEFFVRKMLELNPASVTLSSTVNPRGQAYADTDALSRYGEKHKGLSIGATVTGMAMDAWTYASGAISGLARNAFMRTAGKAMAKGAAGKVLSRPLAGRILGNVVGGGTNFMAYEAGKEAERQLYHGGYVNPETGETEGYSFEAVANSGVHGFGMGAVTGSITPLIGNVADKAVRAASSTGGKLALRGGELAVSKVLEGTIFAAPEIYSFHTMDDTSFDGLYARRFGYDGVKDEKERSEARRKARESLSWDSWGENLAMMTGFGASHLIQSAPKVIRGLRPFKPRVGQELTREQRIHNNRSFRERVNAQLDDSSSDMAFTKDEQDELKRKGYGELSDLFAYDPEYKSRKAPGTETATREQDGDYRGIGGLSRGVDYEPSPRHNQEWVNPEFDGYEAMERLMADKGVSEAVRAKAYHLLTGRMVPPSTVTGYNVEDNHDGSVNVNALNNEGGVVSTRRVRYMDDTDYDESTIGRTHWSEAPEVKAEIAKVERQVELNTIDIGEQYKAAEAERFNRQGALPENIRRLVKEETGVDVDEAIRKEPGKRTEAETKALRLYADKLFDRETEAGSADAQQEETKAEADRIYEDSRLLYGRFEQGDPEAQAEIDAISLRMTEAYELCEEAFGDEAEVYMAEIKENPWGIVNDPNLTPDRKDAALYYINAKAALDGVMDASDEAVADKREMVRKEVERRTHRDFSVIFPATMKADDRQVYIITGYVVMFPDGSGVDVRNSSDSVIILDASGEYKFTSPDQILSVGEAIDPQIELQSAYENIDREQEAIFSAAMEEPAPRKPTAGAADAAGVETTSQGSAAEREEYDQGYEAATTDAREYADDRLGGEIERLRGNADTLTDFGRGWLEALEYEQQRRAMEAGSVDVQYGEPKAQALRQPADAQQEEPETSPESGSIGEGIPGKGNNDGEIIPEKGNNDGENIPGDTPKGETAPSALERIPVDEQTGDPILTHESVDADTAWEAATEFFGTPEDALSYVQAEVNNAKSAITAAEKAVGKVKPTGGMSKYRDSLKAARGKVEAAKATLAKWEAIEEAQKRRKAEEAAAREAETAARNAQLHDEAVARFEEEQRIKAEKQAEQERIGTHAVNPKIKEKWDASTKVDGHPDAITLPDGSTLTGHYVMTEAGAASASHDVNNAFEPTEGFPIDKNGQSVNDRDYKRDMDAQQIVQNMADAYDSRAMQTPVIVSKDGIVLSGNNRTMSGDMAATQGTDGAYLEYLGKYGAKYGFTPEQVATMKHPRVVFVPDEDLPYDANTFSRFNAQEMKSQSKPEAAIKLGKIVDDATFNRIVADLNKYDRLSDFYADQEAAARTLGELVAAGVINDKQLPELRTGTALSATGKELIENTLIGKIFQSEPEAVRMIISMPTLKQSVIIGLNEIANNRTLSAKGYDLSNELSAAVDLVFRAKTSSPDIYKDGMPVSPFGRMQGLFDDEYGDSRVTDATTLLLADLLNSAKPSDVRKVLSIYNQEAGKAAAGYMDMFNPDVRPYTKEEVLNTVNELFRNGTAKKKQELVDAAIADRKQRAAAEQAERGGSAAGYETAYADGRGEDREERAGGNAGVDGEGTDSVPEESITAPLSDTETDEFGKPFVVSSDGSTTFGEIEAESGLTSAPIRLSLGENHKDENGKNHGYGLLHIEAGHGEQIRNAGFGSVEEFVEDVARNYTTIREGSVVADKQTYLLEVSDSHNNTLFIQMSRDGRYWNVNSAGIFKKKYSRNKREVYTLPAVGGRTVTDTPEVDSGQNMGATAPAGNSLQTSDGKGNALSSEKQADLTESSENEGGSIASGGNGSATAHGSLGERIAEAEAQVNLYPTEAQRKAGNYSKGHVNVEGFGVTIEQPKGSVRRGKDANGNPWESKMNNTYGYILGTEGVDGDHIDVFLSDTPKEGNVYVVDQYEPDGTFDEHKVMYGFPDAEAARSAYLSNYEKGWEDTRRIDVTGVTKEDFKKWIQSSRRKTKPFADYKSVKAITEDVDQKRTNINKEGIVTDGEGKPLTLYHGTPNKEVTSVTMLEPGHKRMGEEAPARFNGDGVSFTPEMSAAQDYASEAGHGKVRIFPANIRLNNPYYTLGVANFTPEEAAEFTAGLKAKGHDGIINYASASMREIGALPNEVIVFDKSAILPIEDKNLDGFGYTITPTTYTRKKGKGGETPVWVVKFDRDLSYEEKRALVAYIKEPLADGKKTSRGWLDKESGQFYMRSEAAAKGLAAMLDNSEAVADAQPLSKEDYTEASKPTAEEGLDYKTVDNAEDFMKAVHHDWGETAMVHPASHDTVLQFAERAIINGRNRSSRQLGNALQKSAEFDLYPSEERMMKTAGFSRKQTALTLIDDKGKCVYDIVWHPNQNKGSRNYVSVTKTSFCPAKQKNAPMNRVDVEGLFNELSIKGETKLSDHSAPVKPESAPAKPEPKRMIVDDEMRDMEDELRSLLGIDDSEGDRGDLFRDPEEFTNKERREITALGVTYALKYFDQGIVSFPEFADRMVRRMGEKIRPWLKSFYGGARDIPGYDHLSFTPADEVKAFDVMNFDREEKERGLDPMRTAQGIVAEARAEAAMAKAKKEITEQRNKKRKERDEQTTADTEAIAEQAETTASEAEATAESAVDEQSIAEASEKIDDALEKVNEQLALLGYYEAERVDKDFNEAYGYMRNAEKKALADAVKLAKQLVKDLGIEIDKVTGSTTAKKSKKPTAVTANVSSACGDITINLPYPDGRNLHINIGLSPTHERSIEPNRGGGAWEGDNLEVNRIMFRFGDDDNHFLPEDVTYGKMLSEIQRAARWGLPKKSSLRSDHNEEEAYHGTVTLKDGREAVVIAANHTENMGEPARLTDYIVGVKGEPGTIKISPEEIAHAGAPTAETGGVMVSPSDKPAAHSESSDVWKSFPDVNDEEAVSKWLYDNSAAIWKGVDVISRDAVGDASLRNTFKASNDDSIKEADLGDYINQWLADRIEDMMELHPATVKAWYDYGQRGLIESAIAGRIETALAKEAEKDKKNEIVNGYKRGDDVMWDRYGNGKWEKVKIEDFDEHGNPIFDSLGTDWLGEAGDWERIKPADGVFGEAKRVATKAQEDKKKAETTSSPKDKPADATEKAVEVLSGGKVRKSRKKDVSLKAEEPIGGLFADIFDEPETPKTNEKRNGNKPSQEVAGDERAHTVGTDETGTDGGVPSAGTGPTDKGGAADAKGSGVERGTDGSPHGTDADGELQPRLGNRGRNEGDADSGSAGAGVERGGATGEGSGSRRGAERGGEGLSEGESSTVAGRGSGTPSVKKARKPEARYTRNFRYDEKEGNDADTYTPSQRLEANVKAIETLAEVLFGDKPATDEQKAIMSRFRGWGQVDLGKYYNIDHILRETYHNTPINRLAKAIQKLDPQGDKKLFDAIKRASLSSYYTPTPIARAMNTFLSLAGYRGGALLDPSMGNGMYEGTLPKSIQERTAITGVELDWLSGQLSRMLYPDANVIIGGFEKSAIAPGSFDVVTSNVPFGDIVVNDPSWKNDSTPVKRSAQNRIHNYYAVKMLEATRLGGLVAMLTTSAVMDTPSNQNIRAHIADQGEILGAIRLPDNTFQGTGVVTDMIFIRKWRDDRDRAKTREDAAYKELEQAFLSHYETTAPNKLDGKKEKVQLNGYFEKNPRNLIGEIQAGNQYGKRDAFGLTSKLSVDEIASEIEKAIKRIVGSRRGSIFNPTRTIREVRQAVREAYKGEGDWVSNGNLVIQDGKAGVLTAKSNEYGEVTRTFEGTLKHDKMLPRIKSMIEVRTAMKKLIAGQIEGSKELELMALRTELQKAYDNFVGKYGRLQDKDNSFILDDIDGYTIQALETWKNGKFVGLSDIFTKNSIKPALKLDGKKTPQEAVALSLAEYGYLRPDYLAKALGEDWAEQCGDFVFLKPNSEDDYVTRDEYLSGDVVTKLAEARSAAEKDKSFERNVKALEEVQPVRIPFDDIAIHLGARWIPETNTVKCSSQPYSGISLWRRPSPTGPLLFPAPTSAATIRRRL